MAAGTPAWVRPRLVAFTVGAYVLALSGAWVLLSANVTEKFAELERGALREDVRRAEDALGSRIEALAASNGDWATWDSPYAFVLDRNQPFIDENTQDTPFRQLGLSLMLFVGPHGDAVFAKQYDLRAQREVPADPALVGDLLRRPAVARHPDATSRVAGLVRTPSGLGIVSSRPLLPSSGEGPVHGALVFVRLLDVAEAVQTFRAVHLDVDVLPLEGPEARVAAGALAIAEAPAILHVDERKSLAFAPLRDIDGESVAYLRVSKPREIYLQGRTTVLFVFVGIAVFAAGCASSLVYLVERLIGSLLAQKGSERLRIQFVESSGDGILMVEPRSLRVREANSSAGRLFGGDPVGRALPELVGPLASRLDAALSGVPAGGFATLGEIERPGAGESRVAYELTVARMEHGTEEVLSFVARDVTERRRAEAQTRFVAYHDPLTGLPNRALFQERLAHELLQATRTGRPMAVAFLDLDGFKEVNDSFGHDAADRLLVDVAARLTGVLRAGDTVARQGGDEFLLLAPNLTGPEVAGPLGRRVLDALVPPFQLDGREVHVSGSVGIALSPTDGVDPATLVKHADLAMYQAKESGRGAWQLFDPSLHQRAARLLDLRKRLARALEHDELRLVYQPQVHLGTGRVVGVEALVRWHSPEGVVSPMEFIPVAEQTGLIAPIGEWVMHRACADAAGWVREGLPPVRVAVNVSARQFLHEGVVGTVRGALAASGLDPALLEIEITESVGVRDPEVARRALEQIRELGVTVALDDFGTGHSSLVYLRLFPIDRLKIDRSFLSDSETDEETATLVSAIVRLAHAMRLEVVAEGVETLRQVDLLAQEGCDLLQGYLLSRPVAAERIRQILREGIVLIEPRPAPGPVPLAIVR